MATVTVTAGKQSTHATLAASTQDTVTFSTGIFNTVEVLNRDSAASIFFTVDGSNATVAGDGTYVVLPGAALAVSAAGFVVKLISTGTPAYTVTGYY